ncbi:MAG: iron-sulfur cluster repair di-iron protein [Bacteroidia bacterium]|nr:iron-sulfur cluster repair di-iron protein [Bacteroidia bacterium]MCZ2277758.1 iron-sulfur cluster repair di-iron protein [Bacteroidia bacterium]
METTADNVLNVTLLEPRKKHPTIFARFDDLKEGESLTILNDHDPKPLYYQLVAERGNIFAWEYLEEGPQWWRIKISKNITGEGLQTLGEIVAKDLRTAQIFKKFGLDFCCDGNKTIKEACSELGLDITIVEKELQQVDKTGGARPLPFNDWGPDFLADYIVNTHHSFLRKTLPDARAYAKKVMQVHSPNHPELIKIHELVESIAAELLSHMQDEEQILFPYIKKMMAARNSAAKPEKASFDSVQQPLNSLLHEHKSVGDKLHELREVANNYVLPSDACASYSLLFKILDELEDDTHVHVHLENNILFPKALELEKSFNLN